MIRPAVIEDSPAMVAMAERFHATTPMSHLTFSKLRAAQMFAAAIKSDDAMAWALDLGGVKGAFIGEMAQYPLGRAKLAQEVIFWIEPEARGGWWRPMIAAFEAWAKGQGAEMVALSCFADGRTPKVFERAGYRPVEISTMKVL